MSRLEHSPVRGPNNEADLADFTEKSSVSKTMIRKDAVVSGTLMPLHFFDTVQ